MVRALIPTWNCGISTKCGKHSSGPKTCQSRSQLMESKFFILTKGGITGFQQNVEGTQLGARLARVDLK